MAEQITTADAVGVRQQAEAAEKGAKVTPPALKSAEVVAKMNAPAGPPAAEPPKAPPAPRADEQTATRMKQFDERLAYLDGEAKKAFAARDEERRRARELQDKLEAQQANVYHLSQQLDDARRVRESQELEALDPSERQVRQVATYVKGLEQQLAQQNDYLRMQAQRIEEMSIETQMGRLEAKYPNMDRRFVLASKLANPSAEMDVLAKESHDHVARLKQQGADEYVERLKKRSEQTRPVSPNQAPSGISVPKPQINYGDNSHQTRRAVATHARELLDAYNRTPS